jgi:hypothetical protein
MQYSEYMKRKQQASQKIIGPPAALSGSSYIQMKGYQRTKCCTTTNTAYPIIIPCRTLPPEVSTATPEDSVLGIKPAAYYTNPPCTPVYGLPPQLAAPACCTLPGYQNTLRANNVPTILEENEYPVARC